MSASTVKYYIGLQSDLSHDIDFNGFDPDDMAEKVVRQFQIDNITAHASVGLIIRAAQYVVWREIHRRHASYPNHG